MEVSVFLEENLLAALEDQPWLRNGSHEDYEELRLTIGDKRWNDMVTDKDGRAYFLVFVKDTAPEEILEKVNMIYKIREL